MSSDTDSDPDLLSAALRYADLPELAGYTPSRSKEIQEYADDAEDYADIELSDEEETKMDVDKVDKVVVDVAKIMREEMEVDWDDDDVHDTEMDKGEDEVKKNMKGEEQRKMDVDDTTVIDTVTETGIRTETGSQQVTKTNEAKPIPKSVSFANIPDLTDDEEDPLAMIMKQDDRNISKQRLLHLPKRIMCVKSTSTPS
jgi:hypothetical protein